MPEKMEETSWPNTCRKFTAGDKLTKKWWRKISPELIGNDIWLREKSVKTHINLKILKVSQKKPFNLYIENSRSTKYGNKWWL